jgi:hypothetical protein
VAGPSGIPRNGPHRRGRFFRFCILFDTRKNVALYCGGTPCDRVIRRVLPRFTRPFTIALERRTDGMTHFASLSDDFYVNMNLMTEMELPGQRETVLHFFECLQKHYPTMRKFYCREKRDFVLEEEKDSGRYRWTAVESRRLSSGEVNPASPEAAMKQHRLVLDLAPALLSVSPLDCEALDLLFGFDFAYRGNHNALLAEALGVGPSLEPMGDIPGTRVINYEPSITLAVDEECRTQVRVSTETRTNAFQVRTGDYSEEQLSVYVTARQYGSLDPTVGYVEAIDRLYGLAMDVIENCVVDQILRPLARTIAMK